MFTIETTQTAFRHVLKDNDGRIYSPALPEAGHPLVYLPGHGLHFDGLEVHLITFSLSDGLVTSLEVLCDNGYTADQDTPAIARLIELINA